ncbi:MAG: hypothetical protein QOJ64_3532 [Acidobacteriota bacterium]|jgi:hypothetical protein|nr:hypothetical protein [Acidobacteriota bacterium]
MRLRNSSWSPFVNKTVRHALFVLLFYSLLFVIFFSPVLFYDSLLAPGGGRLGDGLLYHLTFFQSKKSFWDTLLSGGFPMTADPQVMTWYPPSMVLSLLPGMWNVFVVSAYVMASSFTYGYVYTLTQSRFAALVSGIIYGMCGFMMAHQGHTAIIHVAVWPPLIIWSLEMLRREFSRGWFLVGAFAVACCVLAGHLQIVAYSLLLSAAYAIALGWKAPVTRRRYYFAAASLLLLGVCLAGLQLVPTVELARLSTRSEYTFSDFVSYSLPVSQAASLIFPAVFGGLQRYGSTPYFGAWNLTELAGYVGLLPLMLAALGFATSWRKAVSIFWLSVAVIAFLLALGDQTPLAYLTYHLPVLGKFRAPARHFIEMALAVSVLAGLGVHAVVRGLVTKRLLLRTLAVASITILGTLLYLISRHATEYPLIEGGTAKLNALPWTTPAIATPLIVFLLTALTLFYWYRNPGSAARKGLLILIVVADLGSFGWFYSWHYDSPRKSILNEPAFAAKYRDSLRESGQRIVSIRGTSGTINEVPPNISRLWEIPTASVYTPLSLFEVTALLSLRQDGSADPSWQDENNQSFGLMSVRYVFLPPLEGTRDADGVLWDSSQMRSWLGGGCDQPQTRDISFEPEAPFRATTLGIVSRLACSVGVPDGTEVVRISLTGADGTVETLKMLAGRDTAEWAYDCSTVTPQIRHSRAPIYSSFPAELNSKPCEGHFYVTKLRLERPREIRSVELHWAGESEAISIEKLTLIDDLTHKSQPINSLSIKGNRWRLVESTEQSRVYENSEALPRAWLVPEVRSLSPAAILGAIKTSTLPGGDRYDPRHVALVDVPIALPPQAAGASDSARIVTLTDTVMEVRTSTENSAFLVTSDVYYPGWEATVDGSLVTLFRTNYAIRGVEVPRGEHLVRFEFRPKAFYYGTLFSGVSILVLVGVVLWPMARRRRANRDYSVDNKRAAE